LWFQQHGEIGVVWDRPARGHRSQPATTPAAQAASDHIPMHVGPAHAAPARITLGEHAQNCVVLHTIKRCIRHRVAHEFEQRILAPLAARHFCSDLLREDIERRLGNM